MARKYHECLDDIGNRIIELGHRKAKLNGTSPIDEINKRWKPMLARYMNVLQSDLRQMVYLIYFQKS